MASDPEPVDGGPQMCAVPPLTGTRLVGAAATWGILGGGSVVSGLINHSGLGWRLVFAVPASCALFALAAFDLRVALRLAQLRAAAPEGEPTRVPLRTFVGWLLVNLAPFALGLAVGLLSLLVE